MKSFKIDDGNAPAFGEDYEVIEQVVLNCTDITGNNNKFYSMELQESDGNYRIFTHYGRVGLEGVKEGRYILKSDIDLSKEQTASKKAAKPGDNKTLDELVREAAQTEFSKLRQSKEKKGYVPVDLACADVGSKKAAVSDPAKSTPKASGNLDPRIERFVEQIYEEASKTLSETIRTPLGAISQSQIDKGYAKLEEIRKAMAYRDSRLLTKLSSEYYSLIPQRFSHKIDPAQARIDNEEKADSQEELLQLMRDVLGVKDNLSSAIVSKYKAINCCIESLDKGHPEYARLARKVKDTQSRHHGVDLLVNNVYKIELYSTKGRFNPKDLETMELFHGSANKNILGILQRGLLIAPPCAQQSGAAFGRGIYFARHSTKSSQYSTKFFANRHKNGFLFIADVALGKMQKVNRYAFSSTLPSRGYDSVMGVAGADLIHDEYIIYNINQVELRYVIDFTPKARY